MTKYEHVMNLVEDYYKASFLADWGGDNVMSEVYLSYSKTLEDVADRMTLAEASKVIGE